MVTQDVNDSFDDCGKERLHLSGMGKKIENHPYPGFPARLKELRTLRKLTHQAIATRLKVSRPAVTQWELSEAIPKQTKQKALAAVLQTNWAWLAEGTGPRDLADDLSDQAPLTIPAIAALQKDLPVLGIGVGGPDHSFVLNGQVVEYVRRPPGLDGVRGAFAIYVVGDSMSPRFEEGELIFAAPGRPPRIGDDVIVELHGADSEAGPAFVKRLVKKTAHKITVAQFNPVREIHIDQANIKQLYRVLTPGELLGI